jgi:predicted thioesterase
VDLPSTLKPGLQGRVELTVGDEHTAPHVGSGRVRVLATPVVINLLEAAALAAVEHLLPAGHQSLGTDLAVRHFAATPVGMRVHAEAELIGVEGRTLRFRVAARDGEGLGGEVGQREEAAPPIAQLPEDRDARRDLAAQHGRPAARP